MKTDHMIFVFGSNLAGIHGAGAAKFAAQHRGAIRYQGEGLQGQSYALPTMDMQIHPLPIERIAIKVRDFLWLAGKSPELDFQVTRVGCGLGFKTDADIAPLFAEHHDSALHSNVYYDQKWEYELLKAMGPKNLKSFKFWGTYD